MIAFDTNLLVTYLASSGGERFMRVVALVERASARAPVFVSALVVYEASFVLTKVLKVERAKVRRVLLDVLEAERFQVEHEDLVRAALLGWTSKDPGFADLMIFELANQQGATLHTSDADLAKRTQCVHVP